MKRETMKRAFGMMAVALLGIAAMGTGEAKASLYETGTGETVPAGFTTGPNLPEPTAKEPVLKTTPGSVAFAGQGKDVIYVIANDQGELVFQRMVRGADGFIHGVKVEDIDFRTEEDLGPLPPGGPDDPDDPDPPTGAVDKELKALTRELEVLAKKAIEETPDGKGPDIANGIAVLARKTREAIENANNPKIDEVPGIARSIIRDASGLYLREWRPTLNRVDDSILLFDQLSSGLETKAEALAFLKAVEDGFQNSLNGEQMAGLSDAFLERLLEFLLPIILRLLGIPI